MSARIAVFNHLPEILDRFRYFLELHGYTVATFQQELGELPSFVPFNADLVILGHARGFPSNYGEFIHAIRDEAATATLPIIVCTTSEVEVSEEEGQQKIQYVSIGTWLKLEHVLVAIRMALEPGNSLD